jgi:hypothetical protein
MIASLVKLYNIIIFSATMSQISLICTWTSWYVCTVYSISLKSGPPIQWPYQCCSVCGHQIQTFPHSLLITWVTQWVPLLEQELLTIRSISWSSFVFSGISVAQFIVFCEVFYRSMFVCSSFFIFCFQCLSAHHFSFVAFNVCLCISFYLWPSLFVCSSLFICGLQCLSVHLFLFLAFNVCLFISFYFWPLVSSNCYIYVGKYIKSIKLKLLYRFKFV